jgi:hypothetical protein
MTNTTQIPSPPSWAATTEVTEADTPDAWSRSMRRLAEIPEGWSSERPDGEDYPILVELEAHRSVNPEGLQPDAIRVEVPADMFGGRYISAEGARQLAAALTEAADLMDATDVA